MANRDKKPSFWSEFRSFAIKGNALELAIAVVVGSAFTAIVNSLVSDIITPLITWASGGHTDVKNLALTLRVPNPLSNDQPLLLHYGAFLQTVINFFLISLSIFMVFKLMTVARRKIFREGEKAVPPEQKPAQERLLEEIRDLLKAERKG